MDFENLESKIIKRKRIKLRCYSIEKRHKSYTTNNRSKSALLTILSFCDVTGNHVTSKSMWNVYNVDAFEKYKRENRTLEFECVEVKLDKPHAYKFDWNDVNDGLCTKEHLGELQRRKTGGFEIYNSVTMYICVEGIKDVPIYEDLFINMLQTEFHDIYTAHYIPNNTKVFLEFARYKNVYLRQKEDSFRDCSSDDYVDCESSYYNFIHDRSDMSEEDAIMEALENGNGEIFGF